MFVEYNTLVRVNVSMMYSNRKMSVKFMVQTIERLNTVQKPLPRCNLFISYIVRSSPWTEGRDKVVSHFELAEELSSYVFKRDFPYQLKFLNSRQGWKK